MVGGGTAWCSGITAPTWAPRGGLDVPESAANSNVLWVPDLVSACLGAAGAKDLGLRDRGWRGGLRGGNSSELSSG